MLNYARQFLIVQRRCHRLRKPTDEPHTEHVDLNAGLP